MCHLYKKVSATIRYTKPSLFCLFLVLIFFTTNSIASLFDTPVAMITSLEGKASFENSTDREIDFGTDIFIGDLIKTEKGASISLTFYNGCRQEIIDQQTLIQVGQRESVIRNGKFKQVKKIECNIPKAILDTADSHLKAGLVVRAIGDSNDPGDITKLIDKNSFQLKAWTNNGKVPAYKVGEPIELHFISNKQAYVLVNYFSSDGELYHLTPELFLENDKINLGELYSIGTSGAGLIAGSPVGTDFIQVLASNQPILVNHKITKAKNYHLALKKFIENSTNQEFSEQLIKLTISR